MKKNLARSGPINQSAETFMGQQTESAVNTLHGKHTFTFKWT